MINRDTSLKPAVFLHIQKTAGTSIVKLAKESYGTANTSSHGDHLDGFCDFPLKDKPLVPENLRNKFGHMGFISGHFGYDIARHFMRDRYSFTFLRNSTERILSLYYFCRTRDPDQFSIYRLSQEVSLHDFLAMGITVPEVKACIWNNQVWQLAHGYGNPNGDSISKFSDEQLLALAIRHLDDFSDLGFAETFEEDRDRILKGLGIVPPRGRIVSNATPDRPTAEDLPPSTLGLLDELTHLDRELYRVAWERNKTFLGKYIRRWPLCK